MPYTSLEEFLVSAPLYWAEPFPSVQLRQYERTNNYYITAPALVDRECQNCGPTKWKLDGGVYEARVDERSLEHVRYLCKNREKARFSVWIMWWREGGTHVLKAGQHPKLEITIPKEFGDALGDKRPLYIKGKTLRHNNYGIGALTYFRRVIEDTTDEMLDLLEKAPVETKADSAAVDRLRKAKDGTRFEDKVHIAAEVMPPHLRPGGVNPFGDLYELLSIGLHGLR